MSRKHTLLALIILGLALGAVPTVTARNADARGARDDQAIADDVSKSIRTYVYYDMFDWLEGAVKDGHVVLTGQVEQPWRVKEYTKRLGKIDGVRSVDLSQVKVAPVSIQDDRLRQQAARLIYANPLFVRYASNPNRPVHILVEHGRVTLRGVVGNEVERRQAEISLRSGLLAFEVVNELTIEPGPNRPHRSTAPASMRAGL